MLFETVLVTCSLRALAARASFDSISMDTRLSRLDLVVKSLDTFRKLPESRRTAPFLELLASISATVRSPRRNASDDDCSCCILPDLKAWELLLLLVVEKKFCSCDVDDDDTLVDEDDFVTTLDSFSSTIGAFWVVTITDPSPVTVELVDKLEVTPAVCFESVLLIFDFLMTIFNTFPLLD